MDIPSSPPASFPQRAFRRHSSKVGAVCGSAARTDLYGGGSVMTAPTVTKIYPNANRGGGKQDRPKRPLSDLRRCRNFAKGHFPSLPQMDVWPDCFFVGDA